MSSDEESPPYEDTVDDDGHFLISNRAERVAPTRTKSETSTKSVPLVDPRDACTIIPKNPSSLKDPLAVADNSIGPLLELENLDILEHLLLKQISRCRYPSHESVVIPPFLFVELKWSKKAEGANDYNFHKVKSEVNRCLLLPAWDLLAGLISASVTIIVVRKTKSLPGKDMGSFPSRLAQPVLETQRSNKPVDENSDEEEVDDTLMLMLEDDVFDEVADPKYTFADEGPPADRPCIKTEDFTCGHSLEAVTDAGQVPQKQIKLEPRSNRCSDEDFLRKIDAMFNVRQSRRLTSISGPAEKKVKAESSEQTSSSSGMAFGSESVEEAPVDRTPGNADSSSSRAPRGTVPHTGTQGAASNVETRRKSKKKKGTTRA